MVKYAKTCPELKRFLYISTIDVYPHSVDPILCSEDLDFPKPLGTKYWYKLPFFQKASVFETVLKRLFLKPSLRDCCGLYLFFWFQRRFFRRIGFMKIFAGSSFDSIFFFSSVFVLSRISIRIIILFLCLN
jgi:hypothetical protein